MITPGFQTMFYKISHLEFLGFEISQHKYLSFKISQLNISAIKISQTMNISTRISHRISQTMNISTKYLTEYLRPLKPSVSQENISTQYLRPCQVSRQI